MPVVTFVNEFRRVEVPAGANLREVALQQGVSIDRQHFKGLSCKNRGLCGQCKVWVRDKSRGATSPRTWKETLLFFRRLSGWSRLACQVRVQGDVDVFTVAGGPDRLGERPIDAPPTPAAQAKPPVEPPKQQDTNPKPGPAAEPAAQ
jgi:ferredoxin